MEDDQLPFDSWAMLNRSEGEYCNNGDMSSFEQRLPEGLTQGEELPSLPDQLLLHDTTVRFQCNELPASRYLPDAATCIPPAKLPNRLDFSSSSSDEVNASRVPAAWYDLADRVRDEISTRVSRFTSKISCAPPILRHRPSSKSESINPWDFFNIGGAGDFHDNDPNTPSTERTRSCLPSQDSFAGIVSQSPDPDLSKDYLVAGAQGLFCINLGKAGGRAEKLVIYNPGATGQIFKVLPPLFDVHPVVMHLGVDDSRDHYKVLVAGSTTIGTEDPFLITQEYSSTTGEWQCTWNFRPCPWFGLYEYQNWVHFKDSERELLLCVGILDMKLGAEGILMFNLKTKQWDQGPIIPLARPRESPNVIPYHYTTTQIVECGGNLYVFSEQDEDYCVHRLNLRSTVNVKLEEVILRKKTGGRGLQVYPEYTFVPISETLLWATVVAESGYMFCELEVGKDVFICIHKFKPSSEGSGSDGVWEEIYRRKRTRRRAPNWKAAEIIAFLKLKEEGLRVVVGKDWGYISQGLEEKYGYIRDSKACEDLWGTLLKRHTDINNDLQSQNIHPDTSAWANFWGGNDRSKNKVLSLECFEMMDRILSIKPRRKAGSNKKQIGDASAPSSSSQLDSVSFLSHLQVANNPLSSAPSGLETFVVESSNNSLDRGDGQHSKHARPAMTDLTSEVTSLTNFLLEGGQNLTNKQIAKTKEEALKIVKSKLQLEILREKNKARDCANQRPGKSRKI